MQKAPNDELPFVSPTAIPSLPLEITDYIIDIVASQRVKNLRGNLAVCSLVCREWTHRSRSHFFSDCRLLLHYRNTLAFGELLRSPHCTILPHVRLLTMENKGYCMFDRIQKDLKLLAQVESLKLTGSSWAVHGVAPRRGFMASLATVVELDVSCANLGDFDHTLLVICAFPALRRLSLPYIPIPPRVYGENDALFEPYPPYTPPTWIRPNEYLVHPPPLSSLSIAAPAIIPILHWLNWGGSCRLTRLELELPPTMKPRNTPPLVQFLHHACDSLEHLKLSSATADLVGIAEIFDLSKFVHLRTLHFNHLFQQGELGSSLEDSLVSIVRSVKSPALESVCFVFDNHKLFSRVSWEALDEYFSESEFPELRLVRFTREWVDSAVENAYFASDVRKVFPRIDALHLLEIPCPIRSKPVDKLDDAELEI
ncbi:hypothetical protein DFH09DRAFT_1172382 [Mycena vulgaris]|nr:hypothetical protein DFH09DRAFT_1172382 [Mycena vulgaris]